MEAVQYVRRIMDRAEAKQAKTTMTLLDWEKAFDKVKQDKLMVALYRMGVPEQMLNAI